MSKLITGTHHIALKCKDIANFEETIRFYHEILGLEILRTWGEGEDQGAMVSTGNSIIEIFASGKTLDETGTVNHFALATEDTDACVKAVSDAGYEIKMPVTDIVIPADPAFPARIAFCYGPVGEEIEFFCEK